MRLLRFTVMSTLLLTTGTYAYFNDQNPNTSMVGYQMVNPVSASEPTPMSGDIITVRPNRLSHAHNAGGKCMTGEAAVDSVNKRALVEPTSSQALNSTIVFPYQPGDIYQIYTTPLNVTDVQFEPGEGITSVAAGDTLRWEISKTASGAGSDLIEHLFIKPQLEDLTTTLVVTTTMRTYHLLLKSTKNTFMTTVQWKYGASNGAFVNGLGTTNMGIPSPTISMANLDFHYKIVWKRGVKPDWYPNIVFNDGSKTYIQFPSNIQSAPALFIKQSGSGDAAVNYRVVDNYYVIDQVITQAELMADNGNIVLEIEATK